MARLFHLSDLHLLAHPEEQEAIFRSLVSTVAQERERRGPADLLCLTGDIFDSSRLSTRRAAQVFTELLDALHRALGGAVPTVMVPGNHDTRRRGAVGPSTNRLFDAVADAVGDRVWVHRGSPFLAEVLPAELHGLPLWIVACDSTYLPGGLVGAGGVLRQEDLLRAAAIIDGHEPDWPVLFLLHHHLIPTPLTDLGSIDVEEAPLPVRWAVQSVFPALVANGDREELFMTALGAGTALSTLHSLRRSVLVLHGHKHYATGRLLKGTRDEQGDVLLVSAGSAGTAQSWRPGGVHRDAARLWPSFNVIELGEGQLKVDEVAFPWRTIEPQSAARRPMVRATRDGHRWTVDPIAPTPALEPGPRLEHNEACYRLGQSARHGQGRWDLAVERRVRFAVGTDERYVETVEAPTGAGFGVGDGAVRQDPGEGLPAALSIEGGVTAHYTLTGGVARTAREMRRLAGRSATPYGRLELMNRYWCAAARVVVHGLAERASTAFGSATDLGTGLERPVGVRVDPGSREVCLEVKNCPPRTLLRLYWLLEDPRFAGRAYEVPAAASDGVDRAPSREVLPSDEATVVATR